MKSRRERLLPLADEVGATLAAYLRDVRPSSPRREVFLAARAPYHAITADAVRSIARRALVRIGAPAGHQGSHVFRHTAATRMVRGGAKLKDIADVLGHVSTNTTAIYAKLDIENLAGVALAWPWEAP